jgi:ParB/RepB/Spo0J family partition protein
MSEITKISVSKIAPDPENLRKVIDPEDIQTLAENIREHGQLDPIQVFTKDDGHYDLLDGERRWRAFKELGLKTIDAIIVARPSEKELLLKKISRVMQTRSLTFPEEVAALETGLRALGSLDNEKEWSQAAKKMGVKPGTLRERMRITKLSTDLRKQFIEGKLDYTIAHNLGKIKDSHRQEEIEKFIREQNLSSRFVTTKFMETLLEFPKKSIWEVYDIAREREKFRYAKPRAEEVPDEVVDKLDDILADFRKSELWFEAIHREGYLNQLSSSAFNLKRFAEGVFRLKGVLDAFLKKYESLDKLQHQSNKKQLNN